MNTTIIIPGRETQTIPGLTLNKAAVIATFAGDIDLGSMEATETRDGDDITIAFSNRTGTKGSDVSLTINGDVTINSTRIIIPGRETQTIPGVALTGQQVIATFAGDMDLSQFNLEEYVEEESQVVAFSNRTGTKGADIRDIFAAISSGSVVTSATDFDDEDEDEGEPSTTIVIPGREDQVIPGLRLDAQMVKDNFSGEIDLSSYDVEEIDNGASIEVRFTARTGTKG